MQNSLQIDLMDCIKPFLPFSEFYNEPLSDAVEMDKDYSNYKNAIRYETVGASSYRSESKPSDQYFSFMTHPFVLTPATKTLGLFYDNRIRMYSERRISVLQAMIGQPPNPYLKLKIRRDYLIEDALMRVSDVVIFHDKAIADIYRWEGINFFWRGRGVKSHKFF